MIKRPNGMDPKDYKGAKKWSNRQWAWEFLRRDKEFLTSCTVLHRVPDAAEEAALAERHGLTAFKNARYGFKAGGKPKFVVNILYSRMRMTSDDPERYSRRLKVGELVVRFPLYAAVDDKNVLDTQLKAAKKVLAKQLTALAASKNKVVKHRRERGSLDFLQMLRLLDALAAGKTPEEIFPTVFPKMFKDNPENIDEFMKERTSQALDLANHRYRHIALWKGKPKVEDAGWADQTP